MTCVTCIAWQLKDSSLARHGFASCVHAPRWESLPYSAPACLKHSPLNALKIKARLDWLAGKSGKSEVAA